MGGLDSRLHLVLVAFQSLENLRWLFISAALCNRQASLSNSTLFNVKNQGTSRLSNKNLSEHRSFHNWIALRSDQVYWPSRTTGISPESFTFIVLSPLIFMLYEPKAADHINIQKVICFEKIFLLLDFSRFGGMGLCLFLCCFFSFCKWKASLEKLSKRKKSLFSVHVSAAQP